jgi:outer membrane protein OmpA-like peptidoglycan-associated protein
MPSLITDLFPAKPSQHLEIALENAGSAPKPSAGSSSPPDSVAQSADTNLVLEKTVSAPKTSVDSSAAPDSIDQPADMTPKPETGSPETITSPPPAESVQTAPPFQEKMFTVQFPSDSNEFSPEAYALLDDIVDLALRYDGLEIVITGYTDSVGNKDYNRQLSKFRATVVKIYIVGKGVDSKRLFVSGRGPDNPIAPNDTPEGRQLNRRVEIKLQSKQ